MALYKLTERTWVNSTRDKAVPDGSPEASFLLGGAGTEIELTEAKRLGLVKDKEKVEPAETKAVAPEQTQNKAVAPAENKGRR